MANTVVRSIFGYLFGFFFATFGVFLFNGFIYRGLSLSQHIIPLFNAINSFWNGLYQILGSGFMVNFFEEFSKNNITTFGFWNIMFGPTVWPAFLAWFMAGFFIGVFFIGIKPAILHSLIVLGFVILSWIVFGIFASADLTVIFQQNLGITLGEFFTAFISILPGALLGGYLTKDN